MKHIKRSINVFFVYSALDDYGLDVYEYRTYLWLSRWAECAKAPCDTLEDIAIACRMSVAQLLRALQSLEQYGMIQRASDRVGELEFTLTEPSQWDYSQSSNGGL